MADEKTALEQLVTEVQVLRLQPGDVVLLKSDKMLTKDGLDEYLDRASVSISRFVGFRVSVMVLPQDAGVSVLRSGDGTTLLPHQDPRLDPTKPKPVGMDTTFINILKSKNSGGLSALTDALTAEDDSK